MLTKPPCFNDGKDCPRRYIGCRASCDDWHKWLAIHAEEKGREREIKAKSLDADVFLFNQGKRIQQARHREYMKNYGKGPDNGKKHVGLGSGFTTSTTKGKRVGSVRSAGKSVTKTPPRRIIVRGAAVRTRRRVRGWNLDSIAWIAWRP